MCLFREPCTTTLPDLSETQQSSGPKVTKWYPNITMAETETRQVVHEGTNKTSLSEILCPEPVQRSMSPTPTAVVDNPLKPSMV